MTKRYLEVFDRLIDHEGNFTDNPKDDGNWTGGKEGLGELKGTKFGISAAAYPHLDIKNLTLDDAKAIYLRDYWNRLRCDELGAPLDEYTFDIAVNSGQGRAARILQGAVGALRDGAVGPKTIAAVRSKPPMETLRIMFVERSMIFALSPRDADFGRGWFARLFDKTVHALEEMP